MPLMEVDSKSLDISASFTVRWSNGAMIKVYCHVFSNAPVLQHSITPFI
jgi:hypothetical protein